MGTNLRWLFLATVVAGGVVLAVFLFRAPTASSATVVRPAAPRSDDNVVRVQVTGAGMEPPEVRVAGGRPITLVVTRTTDQTCATELVVEGEPEQTPLPLNVAVTRVVTPKGPGVLRYGCAMGMMVSGVLRVE